MYRSSNSSQDNRIGFLCSTKSFICQGRSRGINRSLEAVSDGRIHSLEQTNPSKQLVLKVERKIIRVLLDDFKDLEKFSARR